MNKFILLHCIDTGRQILVNLDKVYNFTSYAERRISFTRVFYDYILRGHEVEKISFDVSETITEIQRLINEACEVR